MNPLSGLFLALCAGAAVVLVGYFALGLHRRSGLETQAGLAALNSLRWRQFADLAINYLRTRGFEHAGREHRPGEGGFDLLLEREGQRHIAVLKPSSAYELQAETVRELGAIVTNVGAQGGILLTTGTLKAEALAMAQRQRVDVIHGERLWRELAPLLSGDLVHEAIEGAHVQYRERLTKLGAAGVATALVLFLGTTLLGRESTPVSQHAPPPVAKAPEPVEDKPVVSERVQPPPGLTEAEEAARRVQASDEASAVDGVVSVGWSSKSTLVLALNGGSKENVDRIVADVCSKLTRYDELKLTRLQVHEFQARTPDEARARFLQCAQKPAETSATGG
jgi:hypothetical protein